MKRGLTLIFIVILTIALIYALVHYIGVQGLPFAISLNFLLMGCALAFTETLKSQLSSPYFHDKAWERGGKVYESVGINLYRKLLVGIGWEKLHKQSKPVRKNIDALRFLHYKTKQDELAHLIIFIIVLGFGIFVAFKFGVVYSLWLFVLNILLNLYPILLQRFNRPRLERAIQISRSR